MGGGKQIREDSYAYSRTAKMMYEYLCGVCPTCGLIPTFARGVAEKLGVEGRWEYIWVTHCSFQSEHFRVNPDSERGMHQAIDSWNKGNASRWYAAGMLVKEANEAAQGPPTHTANTAEITKEEI